MAIYRNIQMAFWTDSKIADDFSPEDKMFYLYLLTNPHTNLCGCYEISKKQVALETGYQVDKINKLLERFEKVHKVIRFDESTKEIILINWHKYNWTSSEKFKSSLLKEINAIKTECFRDYLTDIFNGIDTVSIRYPYGMDTGTNQVSTRMDTTVTVTVTDTVSDTVTDKDPKDKKSKHGTYGHVMLSDKDVEALIKNHGEEDTNAAIEYLDAYIDEKGYKSKNHKSTIERWVFDAIKKNANGSNRASPATNPKVHNFQERKYTQDDFSNFEQMFARN